MQHTEDAWTIHISCIVEKTALLFEKYLKRWILVLEKIVPTNNGEMKEENKVILKSFITMHITDIIASKGYISIKELPNFLKILLPKITGTSYQNVAAVTRCYLQYKDNNLRLNLSFLSAACQALTGFDLDDIALRSKEKPPDQLATQMLIDIQYPFLSDIRLIVAECFNDSEYADRIIFGKG